MTTLEAAKESIERFSINEQEYIEIRHDVNIGINGKGSVFLRGGDVRAKIHIDFGGTEGCRVFLGEGISGSISVFFRGNNSLLYIGNHCLLNDLQIRSFQRDDFVAVGSGVSAMARNVWISGHGAGSTRPAIIIGDDCMFSFDVVIRNSDAHPIFDMATDEQINEPKGIVLIEPHVWIGERASILKSATIGACSIVSLGSIVTKDIPRFSVASGVPAIAKAAHDTYWARDESEHSKMRAKYYTTKYRNS